MRTFVGGAFGPPAGGPARLRFQTLSIREVARRTGFPRSTLQDFLADPMRTRASTVDRLAGLLDDSRLQIRARGVNTEFIDAPRFTRETIADLVPPDDATAVRVISDRQTSPGRDYSSTPWLSLGDFDSVDDALAFSGIPPEGVVRVIFDVS
ncbi:MAG: helix-turn-helix transcriptional regulator [Planctomycetota bacterium]|nr:helix-turn-helix transcriptional regulator [Planctomycetota bacterium]